MIVVVVVAVVVIVVLVAAVLVFRRADPVFSDPVLAEPPRADPPRAEPPPSEPSVGAAPEPRRDAAPAQRSPGRGGTRRPRQCPRCGAHDPVPSGPTGFDCAHCGAGWNVDEGEWPDVHLVLWRRTNEQAASSVETRDQ